MATIAVALPRTSSWRLRAWFTTLLLGAVSAALYGWMRAPVGWAQLEALHGMCARLHMAPGDWPCAAAGVRVVSAQVGAALLTWVAVSLPGVILAASGRRFTWIVPSALAAGATLATAGLPSSFTGEQLFGVSSSPIGSGTPAGFWYAHSLVAVVTDLVLVAVPAAAVAFVLRPPRRPRAATPKRHAAWVATFALAGALAGMRMLWPSLPFSEFFPTSTADTWIGTAFVALFAAMLGTDRRWWPWALCPVAVMLSLGPTMALAGIPAHFVALSWFAGVAPLSVAAFIGSSWRPIAMRLSGERIQHPEVGELGHRVARPTVILNGLGVATLVLSLVAVRADPLPWQISTSLPTFLGERALAFDVRAKTNLAEARTALESYRADRGTFAGFDAAEGEALAPELHWLDRSRHAPLDVAVVGATAAHGTVVSLSASGTVFCLRTDGASATYGAASAGPEGSVNAALVARAVGACGDEPFTAAALRIFDVATMCDGVDDQVIVACRAVQGVIVRTLHSADLPLRLHNLASAGVSWPSD